MASILGDTAKHSGNFRRSVINHLTASHAEVGKLYVSSTTNLGNTSVTGDLTVTGTAQVGTLSTDALAVNLLATNPVIGSAVLVAGTKTVETAPITDSSQVFISRGTAGGTLGHLSVASVTPGTPGSFIINSSSNADTSTVNYLVIN